jgi:hypothetical protein
MRAGKAKAQKRYRFNGAILPVPIRDAWRRVRKLRMRLSEASLFVRDGKFLSLG